MAADHEKADTILRINQMAKDVATELATKTGDELDPEASIYDDSRISLRYSPKDDSVTVVVNEPQGRTPVYIFSGTKSEKPHVFLQGSWQQVLESLHRKVPETQEKQ